MMAVLSCDPDDILPLPKDHDGPFYWPGTPQQVWAVLQKVQSDILNLALAYKTGARVERLSPMRESDLLMWSFPHLVQALVRVLQAEEAIQGAALHNDDVVFSAGRHAFWAAYRDGRPLADQPFLKQLLDGPASSRWTWRWGPRVFRTLWNRDVLRRFPPFLFSPARHTAVTSTLSEVRDYCRANGLRGFYMDPDLFFRPLGPDDLRETGSETQLINDIQECCLSSMDALRPVREAGRLWLRRQIAVAVVAASRYVAQAIAQPDRLPRRVVSNLGGIWNGLLRYAIQKSGGQTYVLDHGCGSALYTYPVNAMQNFAGTSVFYAFSDFSRETMSKNLCPELRRIFDDLKISCFPHPVGEDGGAASQGGGAAGQTRVLLVPLAPIYDRGLGAPYPSNAQALDFNARLVRRLQAAGYEVTMKPHPAFMEFPAEQFIEKYGTSCSGRPFEEVLDGYDLVINCDFMSSTLVPCCLSDKPLVFFNVNPELFSSEMIGLLGTRAVIETFEYSPDGRMDIAWDRLANMIEDAKLRVGAKECLALF